ncbi:hypothetical protein DL771_006601 [Monosporascus sp. 5C6A]|nr:hypothetical protein DL771_006601 [Monosporascus sp. 5C6A]
MLFVIDTSGRPSEYAKFVRIGGGSVAVFAAQNTIASSDVQAPQLQTPPSDMPKSFAVVLNGVSTSDLDCPNRPFPPKLELRYSDDNTIVPGVSTTLSATLLESTAATADTPQRITLEFNLRFTDMAAFNGVPAGGRRPVTIEAGWGGRAASASFELVKNPSAYFLKSCPDFDLRIMRLPRGESWAAVANDDPLSFVQRAVNALRANQSKTDHPFDQLGLDGTVELAPMVGGVEINNFAFAKVRLRAATGVRADDVKVFFRLFNPSGAGMLYDKDTSYSRTTDGRDAAATVGKVRGEVVSMPFFAHERPEDLGGQVDPANVSTLVGKGEDEEISTYFGCWLDFNLNPTVRDAIIRSDHQCMVAEIHLKSNPIDTGSSPFASDRLIQRNLSIVASDNPGSPAAHTVCLPIELSPESYKTLPPPFPGIKDAIAKQTHQVDELFVNWHNLPQDAYATIYFPTLDVGKLIEIAGALRGGSGFLSLLDKHTVLFRIGHASYLPLIWPSSDPVAGLLTVQMPPTVRSSSTYLASVHQISGRQATVVGSFQLTIPVSNAEDLVDQAARDLGVVKGISAKPTQVPIQDSKADRWAGVSFKYSQALMDRVRAFGGDPEPSRGLFISIQQQPGKLLFARYDRRRDLLDGHEVVAKSEPVPAPDQWYSNPRTFVLNHFRPRVGLHLVQHADFKLDPVVVDGGSFEAKLRSLLAHIPATAAGFRPLVTEFSEAQSSSNGAASRLLSAMQMGEAVFQIPARLRTQSTGDVWLGPLPRALYIPTATRPFRGIWVVDYGSGPELLLLCQPDGSHETSDDEETSEESEDLYKGSLFAVKLTSRDHLVPQGEVSWVVGDLSLAGTVHTDHESRFTAARVTQCQARGTDPHHGHGGTSQPPSD